MLRNIIAGVLASALAVGISGRTETLQAQLAEVEAPRLSVPQVALPKPNLPFWRRGNPQQLTQQVEPPAQEEQTIDLTPRVDNSDPKRLRLTLTLSTPEDLKVKEGDEVKVGQVLSDRTRERQRLLAQRQQLELALKRLSLPNSGLKQIAPPPPVAELPAPNYDVQVANIQLAENTIAAKQADIRTQQERIAYLSNLPTPEETSNIALAEDAINQKQLEIRTQQEKMAELQQIEELPAIMLEHESAVLGQLQQDLNTLQLKWQASRKSVESAQLRQQQTIQQEKAQLSKKQEELKSAVVALTVEHSRLKEAQAKHEQQKYERSLEMERRVIARQQQEQERERQLAQLSQQQQEREYQKASVQAQIQNVDNAIANIGQVRSPYAGTIRSLRWLKGSDNTLSVELTIIPDSRRPAPVPEQPAGVSEPTNPDGFIKISRN